MNKRDQELLDRIEPILREIYGTNWSYDFDVNVDGLYVRLDVWGEPDEPTDCDTCGGGGRWQTTLEDNPTQLVDLGSCPDCLDQVTA
jgi:hypothetical protein